MNENLHNIRLNIHFDLPEEEWEIISRIFKSMDGYLESPQGVDDYTCWFGTENDHRFISCSVEPNGFDFRARMENGLWIGWLTKLCAKLTLGLGRAVYDAEM